MLKLTAIIVVVLLAAVLVAAATKRDTFRVQRSAHIKAPPEEIFTHIDAFPSWGSWSPYEKIDPSMKRTYSGAARGVGAIYEWEGNAKVGKGRMEITDASAPHRIRITLDFAKPFEGHNVAEFTMIPNGDATDVTWAMHGPLAYPARVISVFVSMDEMVGKEFETGLANLKAITEK